MNRQAAPTNSAEAARPPQPIGAGLPRQADDYMAAGKLREIALNERLREEPDDGSYAPLYRNV